MCVDPDRGEERRNQTNANHPTQPSDEREAKKIQRNNKKFIFHFSFFVFSLADFAKRICFSLFLLLDSIFGSVVCVRSPFTKKCMISLCLLRATKCVRTTSASHQTVSSAPGLALPMDRERIVCVCRLTWK